MMDRIRDFYHLADTYCRYVSSREMTYTDIPVLIELLMKLYLSAVSLPEAEPETSDASVPEKIQVRFDRRIPVFYWEVFDPFIQDEAVCEDLTDALSDIAAELKNGMTEFEAGRTGNAVHEWKLGLNHHWGSHAVSALRALHTLRMRRNDTCEG